MWREMIVTLIVAVLGLSSFMIWSFHHKVKLEIDRLTASVEFKESQTIVEKDLENMPGPVRRYLEYVGVVGRPKIQLVRLTQNGSFRTGPNQAWMPIAAEQYFTINPPGFLWHAKLTVAPLLSIWARDLFFNGAGNMLIKPLALLTLADVKGPEIDSASLLRFLSEMPWVPSAFLSDALDWEAIDSNRTKATIRAGELEASGIFHFNDAGEIVRFTADRYRTVGDGQTLTPWTGFYRNYQTLNGIRIPTEAEVQWQLDSGDFSYAKLNVRTIEYTP